MRSARRPERAKRSTRLTSPTPAWRSKGASVVIRLPSGTSVLTVEAMLACALPSVGASALSTGTPAFAVERTEGRLALALDDRALAAFA